MKANYDSEINPITFRSKGNDDPDERKLLVGYNSEEHITRNQSNILTDKMDVRGSMAVVPYTTQRKAYSKKRARE